MKAALDIDRDGQVAAVTFVDDSKLPAAIRQRGEQIAKGWKFLPPTKDGKSVGGRTYAGMQVCIMPNDGGIDFTIADTGNGPASFVRTPRKPLSTALPVSKLISQGVSRLRGKIAIRVSVDGKATLESATLDDPGLQQQYGHLWERDQRETLRYSHYLPELVDGVPVATRFETTVEGLWVKREDRKTVLAEMQKHIEQSDACKTLRGDDGRQIASDSPFQRVDG